MLSVFFGHFPLFYFFNEIRSLTESRLFDTASIVSHLVLGNSPSPPSKH